MPLTITSTLSIADDELDFQFVRSSGPGGQNVNKVSTKAVLRWNPTTSLALPEPVRARFLAKYASRLLADGGIQIARDESRSQLRNRTACLDELAAMIRAVLGIVLATFFSDVGHEMVTAVLPLYLASLGLGPAALGVMEGGADLAFSLSKLAGGFAGHHAARKKPLAAAGYTVTALGIGAIAFVSSAFAVGALRIAAWFGRGFRSPLRDHLLADEVEPTHFGRAYGVERTADMLGAVAGPLVALALVGLGVALPSLIALSLVPALLAVGFVVGMTQEKVVLRPEGAGARASHRLPRRFWSFVVGVLLFGLGDFSRTFLIFLVADRLGGSADHGALRAGVLAYTAHNVVSGLAAFPAGRLGDRLPKWQVLAGGYALGVVTNALLAGGHGSLLVLAVAVVGSGIYIAVEETLEKSAVAELLPREQRSFGFGILACANAVGDMVSSLYVGSLLAAGRGREAFALAATFGVAGLAWIVVVGRRAPGTTR